MQHSNSKYVRAFHACCDALLRACVVSLAALLILPTTPTVFAATGVPKILNYQGRLMNSGGTLLGGTGTPYCMKFSLNDSATGTGNQVWPSVAPSTMTVTVKNGVFSVGIGDTGAGGDTLDYNFQDSDAVYLNVEVATKVGATCAPGDGAESYETLKPRPRIFSSGYAINASTLGGFLAAQQANGNQIPVLQNGHLILGGTNPFINATTTNALTFQGGGNASGDIQFFSSANKITASGNVTFAGNVNAASSTIANATSTTLAVTGNASTSNLVVSNGFTFASVTGILKAVAGAVTAALVNLASDVSGVLPVGNGGTGWAAVAAGAVPYGNGTSALATTTAGTNGQVLALVNGVPSWVATTSLSTISGILGVENGGTGASSFTYGLVASPGGNGTLTNIATSSLGLLTTDVAEGDNLYFTTDRVAGVIAGTTTNALAEGSNNKYFTVNRVAGVIAGTTTDALAQGTTNKYYSTLLFAADLAGTTTSALAEGTNKYWTDIRFDNRLSATTTLPNLTTLANLSSVGTITSGTFSSAVSGATINGSAIGAITPSTAAFTNSTSTNSTSSVAYASSFTAGNATSTSLAVTNIASGSLLKATTGGALIAAQGGLDYALPSSTFGYPFVGNSTTTLLSFVGGLLSTASTTIGNGTQVGGLTVSGGATTTGNAYVGGTLTVAGNATLGQATTSNLAISNIVSNSLLKTTTGGALIAAVGGIDYALPSATFGYLFPGNATTTELSFNGGLVASNSTTTNATSTNLAISGTASSSNLVASNSFTFGKVTGFLKAVAGVVSTTLINLASDVTGILPVGNGGTGWASLAAGAVLYGNGSGAVATTTAGINGQILALVNGIPAWVASTTLSTIGGLLDLSNQVTGTLAVSNGGTGSTTLSGLLKGNGTSQVATAVAGQDYQAPISATYPILFASNNVSLAFGTTTANSWSQLQTFTNFTALNGTTTNATSTTLFASLFSAPNGTFGVLSATSSAALASTTAYGRFITGSIVSTSTATSTIAGPLAVGLATSSYAASVMGSVTGAAGAVGTAVMAITDNDASASSANNVLRLNIRTPSATNCTSNTTCPRFIEYYAGTNPNSDTGGVGLGSVRTTTNGTGVTTISGAADFAEYMQLDSSASVGDVVSLNSSGVYQKAVAGQSLIGVISDSPAFVGNGNLEGTTNAYVVGFAGVIKTNVSTDNGPIRAGDLIAASSTPGVGVKLSNSGYALGQALEAWSGPGTGQINVLVLPKFVDANVALQSYGGGGGGITGYWDYSTTTGNVTMASTTYKLVVTNNAVFGNATSTNFFGSRITANTASIGATGSTTIASNGALSTPSLSIGSLSGFLKATAGAVSTSLIDLSNDVSGILAITKGGTGTSTAPTYGKLLVGNSGGGYDYLATSSLGINSGVWGQITGNIADQTDLQSALAGKLSLSAWYATTTSALAEGNNLYFTNNRVASVIAGTTTDALAQGTTNKYYSTLLFAADLAGTSTSALAEGSNKYYTDVRVGSYISGSSTIPHIGGQAYGDILSWTGSSWTTRATSTLALNTNNLVEGNNLFYTDIRVNSYINGSTTIPKTYSNNIFAGTNSFNNDTTLANATSTNLAVTGTASSSNLVASNSFTFGKVTGFLKAVAGVVSSALINLTSDVTGVLPVGNGGTGWAAVAAGAVPYGNGSGALATTTAGTNGQVLALVNGIPSWVATTTLSSIGGLLNLGNQVTGTLGNANGGTGQDSSGWTGVPVVSGGTWSSSSTLAVNIGGTGSTTLGGILTGNGTGGITAAAISGPLSFAANTLSISQAAAGTNGYLSSTDWTLFNGKVSTSSLLAQYPFQGTGNSTSTLTQFGGGLTAFASSTIGSGAQAGGLTISGGATTTGNLVVQGSATTTNLAITSITSGSLLKATTGGALIAATPGTDYANFAFPFSNNATTTQIAFNGGLTANNATTTNATSTGGFFSNLLANLFAVGQTGTTSVAATGVLTTPQVSVTNVSATSTFSGGLSVLNFAQTGTASSTFNNGITLTSGCFAIANNCIGLSNLSGTVGVTQGGTGQTAVATGDLLYGSGTNVWSRLSAGTNGRILTMSNGIPAWVATTTFSSGLTYLNGNVTLDWMFPLNATSTLISFNGGLTALASTTIGNGLRTGGLTISGGATTTGTAYFAGSVGIGTTSPGSLFSINNIANFTAATSSLYGTGGINIAGGCFAIGGACLQGPSGSNLVLRRAELDTPTTLSTAATTTLATVTATPLTTTADEYITVSGTIESASNTDGSANIAIRKTSCAGTVLSNTTVAITLANGNTEKAFSLSAVDLDPGTSLQTYVLCARGITVGHTVKGSSIEALAIDTAGSSGGAAGVTSVSSADGTLTISPTTGSVVAALNLDNDNVWTGFQQFNGFASSTLFSANRAYFGETATTTIDSAGNVAVAGTLNVTGNTTLAAATSSNFAISTILSGSLLKTTTGGALIAAVGGVDYALPSATFGYPFIGNSTTTLLSFTGGLISSASTTIGNGTQAGGLTVSGGATTTGNAYFGGNVGIGTTTPGSLFSINSIANFTTATSSIYSTGGLNLAAGCFAISGNCLSLATLSGQITLTSQVTGILPVANGGTNASSIGTHMLTSFDGTRIVSTSTPTAASYLATSTNATSTFAGGLSVSTLNVASTTATSTFANGITLTSGCFATASGCLTNSTFTYPFPSNATNTLLAFNGGLTASNASSTNLFSQFMLSNVFAAGKTGTTTITSAGTLGIGTSSPYALLSIFAASTSNALNLFTVSSTTNNFATSTFFTITNQGLVGIGATSSPGSLFSINNIANFTTATTSFASTGGLNVASGCFAIAGNCLSAATFGASTFSYLFPNNATTTGLGIYASSTIGNGTQTGGLTVSGGATTTGNLSVSGNITAGQATTTNLAITNIANALLSTNSTGGVVPTTVNASLTYSNNSISLNLGNSNTWSGLQILNGNASTTQISATKAYFGGTATTSFDSVGDITFGNTNGSNIIIPNGIDGALDFATSTGVTPTLTISTRSSLNGLVGVGTSTPWGKFSVEMGPLHPALVVSNAGSSSPAFIVSGINQNGRVGIGTSTPYAQLSIDTTSLGSSPAFAVTSTSSTYFLINNGGNVGIGTSSPSALLSIFAASTSQALNLFTISSTTNNFATSTFFTVTNKGNVGIGATSSPGSILSINNVANFTAATTTFSSTGGINIVNGCYAVNGICIGTITKLSAIYSTSTAGTSTVSFSGSPGTAPTFSGTTLTVASNIAYYIVEGWGGGGGGGAANTNNGGVGSTTCYSQGATGCSSTALIIAGGGGAGGLGTAGAAGAGGISTRGSVTINGSAGLAGNANVTNPSTAQPSGGSSPRGGTGGLAPAGTGSGAGAAPGGGGSGAHVVAAGVMGGGGGGGYAQNVATTSLTTSGTMVVGGGGIGGPAGGTAGGAGGAGSIVITFYSTSTPGASGNDYAELFLVSNPNIGAGDIVAVDRGTPVSMKLAALEDSAPLAGIVSTQPGQVLGDQNAPGMRPIALSGRVPTKVNLEGGPITIGDRIAVSSVAGVGKKAGPFDDSVGIALENFDGTSENATITVFVNLQRGIDVSVLAMKLLGNTSQLFADGTFIDSATSSQSGPLDFVGGMMNAIGKRLSLFNFGDSATTSTSTVTSTTTPATDGFASSLWQSIMGSIRQWLASAANGLNDVFAGKVHTKEICVAKADGTEYCANGDQLAALAVPSISAPSSPLQSGDTSAPAPSASTTPPIISVQGNNPAIVNIGESYADLGATILGPTSDLNLRIHTIVDGVEMSDVVIDTSAQGDHTIIYRATDQNGVVGEATRVVHVVSVVDVVLPTDSASSTDAATTSDASTTEQ